ncbi:hypothetical protein ACOALA_04075 [Alicyclobacillus acidoterrestris]|uniref:hypothetical protein n=1 Tax=Alicyclobacillus acidoterrestris TaxID=1450 RepID=UPI003F530A2C
MPKFETLYAIRHNGRMYKAGRKVEMDMEDAAELVKRGTLKLIDEVDGVDTQINETGMAPVEAVNTVKKEPKLADTSGVQTQQPQAAVADANTPTA